MKFKEIKTKSADEIKGIIADSKKERFNLRLRASGGEAVPGSQSRALRKTIARAKTALNQKKKDQ